MKNKRERVERAQRQAREWKRAAKRRSHSVRVEARIRGIESTWGITLAQVEFEAMVGLAGIGRVQWQER